jgi:hypothetical protein
MITDDIKQAILGMHEKGIKIRQIALSLDLSRNTVKSVLKGSVTAEKGSGASFQDEMPLIREVFLQCQGNVVRVVEILAEKGIVIGYSTLTRIARNQGLRESRKTRAGAYSFGPGEEMQHDTSPHKVLLDGKPVAAQCARIALAYARRIFIRHDPCSHRLRQKSFWQKDLRS